MNKKILIIIIALIVVGGGAFYGGLTLGKTQQPQGLTDMQNAGDFAGRSGMNNGSFAGPPGAVGRTEDSVNLRGSVLSVDDDGSVVLELADNGGSKIVMLSDSTQIMETKAVESGELTEGKSVIVMGTTNDDGTVSADNIMLRDASAELMMGPPPGTSPESDVSDGDSETAQ